MTGSLTWSRQVSKSTDDPEITQALRFEPKVGVGNARFIPCMGEPLHSSVPELDEDIPRIDVTVRAIIGNRHHRG